MGIKNPIPRVPASLLTLLILLSAQQPAALAHTSLVSANPGIASEVDNWPTSITLEFDEELQNLGDEKANFVVVNNAVGDQVSEADEQISGNTITVTLAANEVKGSVLVFYHVVSGDGHPVEGEYKFTYGVGQVTAQGVDEPESTRLPIGIYIASAIFIISGLFFSIFAYRRRNK
ncbi:MAG: copper resistance CopC family protein [Candidatus Nanopelagicus sp.]